MDSASRKAHIKRLVLAVTVAFFCLLQFSGSFFQKSLGAGILYIIPVIICISMFQGETVSICCAVFAGVFWDSVSAQSVCFNSLFITIAAFLVSYAVQKRLRNFFITAVLLNFGTIILYETLHWLRYILLSKTSGALIVLFKFYLPSTIATCIISIPIYYFIRFIHKKFGEM